LWRRWQRVITPEDYFLFESIGDAHLSPDGKQVVYALTSFSKVKTPTLILHSGNDYRVPLEKGEQWFRALKHYGVNTELVIFPRENHNLTRTGEPKHQVESLNWQCYWFDQFLNLNANAKPPDTL
jgi:pimeloyl-ACP methyl ester carboxylesterase